MSYNSEHTQLTSPADYDTSRMIFSEPNRGSIPDSKAKIEFMRINIGTRNEDGTTGELVIPTSRLFSYGVSENTSQETGAVNGYTFPLCLWSQGGSTSEEKAWTDTFENIVDKCINHLIENKEEIERFDLRRDDLTRTKGGLNPLYWKRETTTNSKGKKESTIVPGTGPTLYTKLIFSKKNNKFLSQFFDKSDKPLDPLTLMSKFSYATCAVKIESIFIGSKISLQVKLYEAVVEPTSTGPKRLLRPEPQSKVLAYNKTENQSASAVLADDDSSETGSISDNDDAEETKSAKPEPKKPVRKVKKVVRRAVAKG